MNLGVLAWLVASTAVFVAANGVLKTYATQGGIWVLVAALATTTALVLRET